MNDILVLNAGSATLKWALFDDTYTEKARGVVERIGGLGSFAEWRLQGKLAVKYLKFKEHRQALGYVLKILAWHHLLSGISLVGHRVVHGGTDFSAPARLTGRVLSSIKHWQALAPLHNPTEIEVAELCLKLIPRAKQWVVFDTAWFVNLPPEAQHYALPLGLSARYGIRRYGFHGLSHSFVVQQAALSLQKPLAKTNFISCHLGNGCSVVAARGGKPIDVSMGFTPLEGLVMGTRTGDIDPGVLIYLLRRHGLTVNKLAAILNQESGLKGLAGVADMREVLIRAGYEILGYRSNKAFNAQESRRAKLALRIFLYRLQKYIGAYAAILGRRVDAIIFTGGIGERNEVVRNLVMEGLPSLQTIPVLAISTNEELAIAREIVSKNNKS